MGNVLTPQVLEVIVEILALEGEVGRDAMEQQPQFPVLAQRLEIAFQLTELERLLGWGEDVQDEINALQQQMQQLLQQLQNLVARGSIGRETAPPAAGRRAHSEPPRRRYGDDDDGAPRFRHRSAQ